MQQKKTEPPKAPLPPNPNFSLAEAEKGWANKHPIWPYIAMFVLMYIYPVVLALYLKYHHK